MGYDKGQDHSSQEERPHAAGAEDQEPSPGHRHKVQLLDVLRFTLHQIKDSETCGQTLFTTCFSQ